MDMPTPSFKNRTFRTRLGFAAAGIRTVARREKSFRTQLVLAAIAAGAALWLRSGWMWGGLLLLAAALVLALEMVTAALEYLMDELHPQHAREIGHAKDAAAGAVLLASGAAAATGLMMIGYRFASTACLSASSAPSRSSTVAREGPNDASQDRGAGPFHS